MSFTEDAVGDEPFAADDLDDGQEVEGGDEGSSDEAPEAEADLLDVDAYGNHLVTVTVDGEEQTVPLSELRGGYQRQADYTRKTQEVAAQRQEAQAALALMAAYRQDPEGTLAVLAQEAGFDFGRPQPDGQELSPLEQRLIRMEQAEARRGVEVEVARCQAELGDLFDPSEAVAFAIQNKVNITTAAKQLAADKLLAERARGAAQAARQADDKTRTAAKRSAQVAPGHSAKGGNEPVSTKGMSTREIYELVKQGKLK
jgi:hypothetical protein